MNRMVLFVVFYVLLNVLIVLLVGCASRPTMNDYYLLCNGEVGVYTGNERIGSTKVECK
jgi:uncharacterized lipoprotein YmbA